MVINLRLLHLLPLLAVLLTQPLFAFVLFPDPEHPFHKLINYALAVVSVAYPLWHWRRLTGFVRIWFGLLLGGYALLTLESTYHYGTPMQYPHVFFKVLAVFNALLLYTYYRNHPKIRLGDLVGVIMGALVLNLVLVNGGALRVASFMETERGLRADDVYILLLPALYFLNQYLFDKKLPALLLFFGTLLLIVFFQHRTVWIATLVALVVTALLVGRSGARVRLGTLVPLVGLPLVGGGVLLTLLVSAYPEMVAQFAKRLADIENAKTQGTGSWRLEQFNLYMPYVHDHLLMGMRLRGFELPVQFLQQDGTPVWPAGTGHHFHSFYVDRLFYFGLAGLLLTLVLPALHVARRLWQTRPLTRDQVTLAAFFASSIAYGFSYDWPDYYYGLLGLVLLAFDQSTPRTGRPTGMATHRTEKTVSAGG